MKFALFLIALIGTDDPDGGQAHAWALDGNLTRAAIELAKDWRTDRRLRRLEALLCVADKENSFIISGNGDVIEPENSLMAIGSGGPYAQAAAQAQPFGRP